MFIPLHDANNLEHIRLQFVTIALIAINVAIWILTASGAAETIQGAAFGLGYIPAVANDHAALPRELVMVPAPATYITYAFLHADILHLGGNMLFLWVFGDNVEDAFGHFRFLVFYLACAAAGAFMHGVITPLSEEPLIGASGAVAGIVAAYLILHPKVRLWVLAFGSIPLRIPAAIPLAVWVIYQFYMLIAGDGGPVSWSAHIGGMIAGAILIIVMRRRDVPLFDRSVVTPKAVVVAPKPVPVEPEQMPWGRH